ncbi:MAG: amidase family protein [Chitinophagales bacterium]
MKPATKRIVKAFGIVVGVVVLTFITIGVYLFSIMPKPIGFPPQLQTLLFTQPSQPFPMEGKYIYESASSLAFKIRSRQASSADVVKEYIANIKNNNFKYNALIWLREEEAIHDAQVADEMVARGDTADKPLLGVPVTIKEMYWVKGSPSTLNVKMFGFTAPDDATVVKQLKKAGAVILGTTNVPYRLADYQTQGEVYPTANNPYDTTRTPGGSTGGGAAALAAGFTSLELGSDMGGSIRIPAAFCGLYGLKTTFGTINITQGSSPDTTTRLSRFALASGGPLARTPQDLQLMWNVLKETPIDDKFQKNYTPLHAFNKGLYQYRIAWIDDWKSNSENPKVGADVKIKLQQLLDSLAGHGVQLNKTAPDIYTEMRRSFLESFAAMIGENQPWIIRKLISMDFKKMDDGSETFKTFYNAISDCSDAKWQEATIHRNEITRKWEEFFKQYDLFICPLTYGPAIKKCPTGSTLTGDNENMPYMHYFPYTYIFNASGLPAVIIPMGLNKDGLPIAIQVVGPLYSEDELLHFAKLIAPFTPGFIKPNS